LEAVGRSLKACPQALFIWAGRDVDPKVAGALRVDMGAAARVLPIAISEIRSTPPAALPPYCAI